MSQKKDNNSSRRKMLKKVVESASLLSIGGLFWGGYIEEAKGSELVLRPPGALKEKEFLKTCIKCGLCVEACPYDTLKLANADDSVAIGTPFFTPRITPCYMCTDIPCVPICPTESLSDESVTSKSEITNEETLDINKSEMGLAILDTNNCLAFLGVRCDACYRACPLMGEAITLDLERNTRTNKHALIKPHVHADICTGCGMCEHACVTEKPSIIIFPKEKVQGKLHDDYIIGWDKSDEVRMDSTKVYKDSKTNNQSTLDYLNDTESILKDD